MKININKEESSEKLGVMQLLGLSKPTKCWEIHAYFELNDEERAILNKHPEIKKDQAFPYRYRGTDLSPSVGAFTDPSSKGKGMRLVAHTLNDLNLLVGQINGVAEGLKKHLNGLSSASGSSSTVTEI